MSSSAAVLVDDVWKTFGKPPKAVQALRGISLEVPTAQVLGLLGPNGSGKTTAVRVLTTLIQPDRGRAEIEGIDVVRSPGEVRKVIGLAGQFAAVDENLDGPGKRRDGRAGSTTWAPSRPGGGPGRCSSGCA